MSAPSRHLSSGSPTYRRAKELLKTDPTRAVTELIHLASKGDVRSITELARCYALGLGIDTDSAKAEEMLRQAADAGDMWAYFLLGRICFRQKRYEEARKWLSIAAAAEFSPALFDLGKIYFLGLGVEKDRNRAARFFERAATAGSIIAKARWGQHLMKAASFRQKIQGFTVFWSAFFAGIFTALKDPNNIRLIK